MSTHRWLIMKRFVLCSVFVMTISTCAFAVEKSNLEFDGRFTTPGTYGPTTQISGQSNLPGPPPWQIANYVGKGSQIVVYDATTKQPGWPKPYKWSKYAAAFTSFNDMSEDSVRAQVHSITKPPGSEIYLTWAGYVPGNIPDRWPVHHVNNHNFYCIQENYGPPFHASPATGVSIIKENNTVYLAGCSGWSSMIWRTPMPFNHWFTVTEHLILSKDPSQGLEEIWVNGVKQPFIALPAVKGQESQYDTNGQYLSNNNTTAHIATMLNNSNDKTSFYLNNYRAGKTSKFGFGPITIFFGGMVIGKTYESVAP